MEKAKVYFIKEVTDDNLVKIYNALGKPVEDKVIKKNYVGDHLENYDSMFIISHFKGRPMGKCHLCK